MKHSFWEPRGATQTHNVGTLQHFGSSYWQSSMLKWCIILLCFLSSHRISAPSFSFFFVSSSLWSLLATCKMNKCIFYCRSCSWTNEIQMSCITDFVQEETLLQGVWQTVFGASLTPLTHMSLLHLWWHWRLSRFLLFDLRIGADKAYTTLACNRHLSIVEPSHATREAEYQQYLMFYFTFIRVYYLTTVSSRIIFE